MFDADKLCGFIIVRSNVNWSHNQNTRTEAHEDPQSQIVGDKVAAEAAELRTLNRVLIIC